LSDIPTIKAGGFGSVTVANVSSLEGAGDLTGLGSTDASVSLEATAIVEGITCTNHGQQLVEAQPRTISLKNIKFIPRKDITKNGRASFSVTTSEDQVIILPPSLFCPNDNWDVTINQLLWRGTATLTAIQPDQTLTLKFDCEQPDVNQPFTCTPLQ
jgi:hypothetical protein